MSAEPKKRGPKPKPASDVKRRHLAFRLQDRLHERLALAAASSGFSISEEIERRVEQSFTLEDEFGTGSRFQILRMISLTLAYTELLRGRRDYNCHEDFAAVRAAVTGTLDNFMNQPGVTAASPVNVAVAEGVGHAAVAMRGMSPELTALLASAIKGMSGEQIANALIRAAIDQSAVDQALTTAALSHKAKLEDEIIRLAAASDIFTWPDEEKWRASMLEWANSHPGGLEAARAEVEEYGKRDRSEDEPGAFQAWVDAQKVAATSRGER